MNHHQHDWREGTYYHDEKRDRWLWLGRYTKPNGQLSRKCISGATGQKDVSPLKIKVEKWLDSIDRETGKKIICKNENVTLTEWANIWLGLIKTTVKPRTYEFYEYLTRKYVVPAFPNVRLQDLSPLQIQAYLNDLYNHTGTQQDSKLNATTVNSIRGVLRTIYKSAIENEIVTGDNPVKKVKLIKGPKVEKVVLNREQMLTFLDAANHNDYIYVGCQERHEERQDMLYMRHCVYAIVYLTMTTGMRIGETLSLKWESVNLDSKCLFVKNTLIKKNLLGSPKTATSNRKILITDRAAIILRNWQKEQAEYAKVFGLTKDFNKYDFVFANAVGNSISYHNFIRRAWKKLCKYTKVPEGFTPHCMRHSYITLALQNQVPIKILSEIVGDDAKTILKTYAHALPSAQKEAVNIMNNVFNPTT